MIKRLCLFLLCFSFSVFGQYAPISVKVVYTGPEYAGVFLSNVELHFASPDAYAGGIVGTFGLTPGNYYVQNAFGYNAASVAGQNPYYLKWTVGGVPHTLRGLNYSGSGQWVITITDAYADIDLDIPDPSSVCFTNTFAQSVKVTVVLMPTEVETVSEIVTPGSVLCYESTSEFIFKVSETTFDPVKQEFRDNIIKQVTMEYGGEDHVTLNGTDRIGSNPGGGNALNPDPDTDTERQLNGVINQLQQNQASENSLLGQILEKMPRPATDEEIAGGLSSAMSAISAATNAIGAAYSGVKSQLETKAATLSPGIGSTYAPIVIPLGVVSMTFDPANMGDLSELFRLLRFIILLAVQLWAAKVIWDHLKLTLSTLIQASQGAACGWLQAPPISLLQAVSTLAAKATKWVVLMLISLGAFVSFLFLIVFGDGGFTVDTIIAGFSPAIKNALSMMSFIFPWGQIVVVMGSVAVSLGLQWLIGMIAGVVSDFFNSI